MSNGSNSSDGAGNFGGTNEVISNDCCTGPVDFPLSTPEPPSAKTGSVGPVDEPESGRESEPTEPESEPVPESVPESRFTGSRGRNPPQPEKRRRHNRQRERQRQARQRPLAHAA